MLFRVLHKICFFWECWPKKNRRLFYLIFIGLFKAIFVWRPLLFCLLSLQFVKPTFLHFQGNFCFAWIFFCICEDHFCFDFLHFPRQLLFLPGNVWNWWGFPEEPCISTQTTLKQLQHGSRQFLFCLVMIMCVEDPFSDSLCTFFNFAKESLQYRKSINIPICLLCILVYFLSDPRPIIGNACQCLTH